MLHVNLNNNLVNGHASMLLMMSCDSHVCSYPIFSKGLISKFFSNQTLGISIEIPYETLNVIQ